MLAAWLVACGVSSSPVTSGPLSPGPAGSSEPSAASPSQGVSSVSPGSPGSSASPRPSARTSPAPGASPSTSSGWTVTVYYTAVARFHTGKSVSVTGCPSLDCSRGKTDLGSYPEDFVKAVKEEGAGKISDGRALEPWVTAAADRDVLRLDTRFTIASCGRDDGGGSIDAAVCAKLRSARWVIKDEFTPGMGGTKHVDVYIGEETGPNFTDSPWYITLTGATLTISR